MRRSLVLVAMGAGLLLLAAGPAAATTTKSVLYHDGSIVRTVVVPVAIPGRGTDPFYSVTNGVDGQLGIAGVAPGDGPSPGGAGAVKGVTSTEGVEPYLL